MVFRRRACRPALALFADCDGPADAFLVELARSCGPGLRQIFGCCEGFDAGADLLAWLRRRQHPMAANYVNWVGRTVRQIREEAALHEALSAWLEANAATVAGDPPQTIRRRLIEFVAEQRRDGALTLSPPEPTPLGWRLRNLLHAVGVPLALLVASPLLILYLPLFFWLLRRHERRDPEILLRPDPDAPRADRRSAKTTTSPTRISSWAISNRGCSGCRRSCFCCG